MLRLLEDFPEPQVTAAVQDAVARRLIGFDAVKHLLLARIERRPVHLDLARYRTCPGPSSPPPAAPTTPPCWPEGPVMAEAPRILLEHHLKRLKLPTFLREYEKLARKADAIPLPCTV